MRLSQLKILWSTITEESVYFKLSDFTHLNSLIEKCQFYMLFSQIEKCKMYSEILDTPLFYAILWTLYDYTECLKTQIGPQFFPTLIDPWSSVVSFNSELIMIVSYKF